MNLKKVLSIILTVAVLMMTLIAPAFAGQSSISAGNLSGGKATFTITLSGGISGAEGTLTATGGTISSVNTSAGSISFNNGSFAVAASGQNSLTLTVVCASSGDSVTLAYNILYVNDANGDDTTISPASGSATARAAVTTTKPTTTKKPTTTAKPTTTKPTTTKPTTTASTAANLKSLSVDGYSLTPKFSQGRTAYSIEVPADFSGKLDVNATPLDSKADVKITGNDIKDGKGIIKVAVKGTDGTEKTYTITVTPPVETTTESPVTTEAVKLSGISISKSSDIDFDFQPDVLEYTVKVPAGTTSLDVGAWFDGEEEVTVDITGADDLQASNNKITITATDANGNVTVYTINVEEETPLAQSTAKTEAKGGMPVWLAIMLILLALIIGIVIGFFLGKKKAEDDYYDGDDDDNTPPPVFNAGADEDESPVSSPYSGGMNFNPPSVGGANPLEFNLPYEAASPVAENPAPAATPTAAPASTPIVSADSFIQSAD